jgi:hypothetical protein
LRPYERHRVGFCGAQLGNQYVIRAQIGRRQCGEAAQPVCRARLFGMSATMGRSSPAPSPLPQINDNSIAIEIFWTEPPFKDSQGFTERLIFAGAIMTLRLIGRTNLRPKVV